MSVAGTVPSPRLQGFAFGAALVVAILACVAIYGLHIPKPFDFALTLAVLVGLIVVADRNFPLLRDVPPGKAIGHASYSLGRTQMAFWTCLVMAGLIYTLGTKIAACTVGPCVDYTALDLDKSILALIGISGVTGVAAMAVDIDKDNKNVEAGAKSELAKLESKALQDDLIAAKNDPNRAAEVPALEKKLSDTLLAEKLAAEAAERSKRDATPNDFFRDLLQDTNGNSMHRVQMILFTLITGAIFISQIIAGEGGKLPAIPTGVLELLGISSSLYVGFKIPN